MTQKTRLHHLWLSALAVLARPHCAVAELRHLVAALQPAFSPIAALRGSRFALAVSGPDMTLSGRTERPQPNCFGS
ncbi:hypothetical protein KUV89_04900 [Marinobacter hydrocarbonoclasticus]|nr:hypothetical protein [Marinobacter nauticus]